MLSNKIQSLLGATKIPVGDIITYLRSNPSGSYYVDSINDYQGISGLPKDTSVLFITNRAGSDLRILAQHGSSISSYNGTSFDTDYLREGDYGLGGVAIKIPDDSDIYEYFSSCMNSGFYCSGVRVTNAPFSSGFYDYIWVRHEGEDHGQLVVMGVDGGLAKLSYKQGVWKLVENYISRGQYGLGSTAIWVPDNTDIYEYFKETTGSGFYKGGSKLINAPFKDSAYEFIWINHTNKTDGQLIVLGFTGRMSRLILKSGTWVNDDIYSSNNKPTTSDVYSTSVLIPPTNSDLDDYSTPGQYFQPSDVTGKNYPFSYTAGQLEVKMAGVATIMQEWTRGMTGQKAVRFRGGGDSKFRDWIYCYNSKAEDPGLVPIGYPLPSPVASVLPNYLECNGQSFSSSDYPELAKVYPNLKVPDLRDEFIRGYGVNRAILSKQNATAVEQWGISKSSSSEEYTIVTRPSSEVTSTAATFATRDYDESIQITSSPSPYPGITKVTSTGSGRGQLFTVRPRNVAFKYVVRAK